MEVTRNQPSALGRQAEEVVLIMRELGTVDKITASTPGEEREKLRVIILISPASLATTAPWMHDLHQLYIRDIYI